MNERETATSEALTALAYQLDSWASNGLLGAGVQVHTPQTDTGRHIARPADPQDEEIVVVHAGGELRLRSAGDGTVEVEGAPAGQGRLRLGADGNWRTPEGNPLSADWLRGLLGTSPAEPGQGPL